MIGFAFPRRRGASRVECMQQRPMTSGREISGQKKNRYCWVEEEWVDKTKTVYWEDDNDWVATSWKRRRVSFLAQYWAGGWTTCRRTWGNPSCYIVLTRTRQLSGSSCPVASVEDTKLVFILFLRWACVFHKKAEKEYNLPQFQSKDNTRSAGVRVNKLQVCETI